MSDRNKNINLALDIYAQGNKTLKQVSKITGVSVYKMWVERKKRGLVGPYRQLKYSELKLLMSDLSITEIAARLQMTNEQVSQYKYKHKKILNGGVI